MPAARANWSKTRKRQAVATLAAVDREARKVRPFARICGFHSEREVACEGIGSVDRHLFAAQPTRHPGRGLSMSRLFKSSMLMMGPNKSAKMSIFINTCLSTFS